MLLCSVMIMVLFSAGCYRFLLISGHIYDGSMSTASLVSQQALGGGELLGNLFWVCSKKLVVKSLLVSLLFFLAYSG